MAKFLWKVNKK